MKEHQNERTKKWRVRLKKKTNSTTILNKKEIKKWEPNLIN